MLNILFSFPFGYLSTIFKNGNYSLFLDIKIA
nr:MAG TPA: hypothetical protein [Caudoviricetes sp.]